jgi:UDP-N-acetylmuramate--alanine ligase
MSETPPPPPPRRCHLVGIGGIGMSGLAQLLRHLGHEVGGSDRALDAPENAALFAALRAQGIRLFPQDGSFAAAGPADALVYSTAIEEGNPDFLAAPATPRLHRSTALAAALGEFRDAVTVAVTGSCGKTTVTAWLAAALARLGHDPTMLCGGHAAESRDARHPGNFRAGDGKILVFEADESDKSLLAYAPDHALVLNLGTDHYPEAELVAVFRQFLAQTRRGAVVGADVAAALGGPSAMPLPCRTFGEAESAAPAPGCAHLRVGYTPGRQGGPTAHFADGDLRLPVPGRHNALNAAAVRATLEMLGHSPAEAMAGTAFFPGVHRRFEDHGRTARGTRVLDDYAHNVEKIAAAIALAAEMVPGRVFAVFQPHGFGPLGFMREPLLATLGSCLRAHDRFIFLPVFYAGGSSSFAPTSAEVAEDYRRRGLAGCRHAPDRAAAAALLAEAGPGDAILVLGARDNSLAPWAEDLARS